MKKLFGLLLGFLLLSGQAFALSGDKDLNEVCGNDNSNTSVSVASAITSKTFRVYGVFLSTASADEVALKIGSNNKLALHLGANSGISQVLFPLYISGDDNEAITLEKTGATDLHYCIWYSEE